MGTPTDPPSRHLYAYAAGEPIGRWDPDGRHWYLVKPGDWFGWVALKFYGNSQLTLRVRRGNPGPPYTPRNLNYSRSTLTGRLGQCIWVPFTQRTHECNKSRGDSVQRGDLLWHRFDQTIFLLTARMQERARDNADGLGIVNFWVPGNVAIYTRFRDLVCERCVWDVKHEIETRIGGKDAPFWAAVRDDPAPESFRSDLYGLIHYGYVGRAHGIGANQLRFGNTTWGGTQGRDDDLAMELGMDLWETYGRSISATRVRLAVLQYLPKFRWLGDALRAPLRG